MKKCLIALALAIFSYGLMTPALSISVGIGAENGGKMVSSSSIYSLDKSASLHESATLGDGEITKDLTASGSGNNHILISSSANGKNAGTELESSGDFQTAAFACTFDDVVLISQDTAMSGSYGGITYHADSPENRMVISTGFEGEGDLKAGVSAAAGQNAAISGNVKAQGVEMLDDESMQIVGSGDIAMSSNGLSSLSDGGLGRFGLSATNTEKRAISSDTSALLAGSVSAATGGPEGAYTLLGYKWNKKDPQLKWVVKNDAYLTNEGLSTTAVKSAIEKASNTWDDVVTPNLFADSHMVTLNPTVTAERYNKLNTISWKPMACTALAYAKTYYTKQAAYSTSSVLDSDLVFNTNYNWRTDSTRTGIDVQSVALHEMGHTLGLGDLYLTTTFKYNQDNAMSAYTGEQRTLGNGDIAGIKKLYN